MTEFTQILSQIENGDPTTAKQLLALVYDELRKLAAARMAGERPDHDRTVGLEVVLGDTGQLGDGRRRVAGHDHARVGRVRLELAVDPVFGNLTTNLVAADLEQVGAERSRRSLTMISVCVSNRDTTLSAAGTFSPKNTRRWV